MFARVAVDERVEIGVAELVHGAAGVADEVVMVPAVGELVADAAIIKRKAADDIAFLQEFDGAEDRRAANRGSRAAKLFDRERGAHGDDRIEDSTPRLGEAMPATLDLPASGLSSRSHLTIVGGAWNACQSAASSSRRVWRWRHQSIASKAGRTSQYSVNSPRGVGMRRNTISSVSMAPRGCAATRCR